MRLCMYVCKYVSNACMCAGMTLSVPTNACFNGTDAYAWPLSCRIQRHSKFSIAKITTNIQTHNKDLHTVKQCKPLIKHDKTWYFNKVVALFMRLHHLVSLTIAYYHSSLGHLPAVLGCCDTSPTSMTNKWCPTMSRTRASRGHWPGRALKSVAFSQTPLIFARLAAPYLIQMS